MGRSRIFQALDDTHFHLLVFGQPAPADEALGLDGLLRIHVIPESLHNEAERERVAIPRQSFFLLRPDGHVGLRGTRVDAAAVRRYAESRLRMAKSPA